MTEVTRASARLPEEGAIAGPLGKPEFIAIIAAMMAMNALAIDIVLPAYPELAAAFGLGAEADVGLVLVTYILGFGIGQLGFGPVSDRFGRRRPLFAGLALYGVVSLLGAVAPSYTLLLVLRFLQGVGAAATRVIALAVVRDTLKGRAMASLMSLVMMVFMVVPILAPVLGEGLLLLGDWRGIFLTMTILCAVMAAWAWVRLPETLVEEKRRPLTGRSIAEAMRIIVSDRTALGYSLGTGFIFSALFAFITLAQPVYVGVYGLERSFTLAFGGVAALMAVASFWNSSLVQTIGARRLCQGALIGFAVLSAVLALLCLGGNPGFWVFFGLIALIFPLFGLIGANMNAIAMEPLGAVAGSASSVLGFLQSVVAGLIGAGIASLFAGEVVVLAGGLLMASLLSIAAIVMAERGKLFRAPGADET